MLYSSIIVDNSEYSNNIIHYHLHQSIQSVGDTFGPHPAAPLPAARKKGDFPTNFFGLARPNRLRQADAFNLPGMDQF